MKYDLQELVHWDENCKVFYVPVEGAKLLLDEIRRLEDDLSEARQAAETLENWVGVDWHLPWREDP